MERLPGGQDKKQNPELSKPSSSEQLSKSFVSKRTIPPTPPSNLTLHGRRARQNTFCNWRQWIVIYVKFDTNGSRRGQALLINQMYSCTHHWHLNFICQFLILSGIEIHWKLFYPVLFKLSDTSFSFHMHWVRSSGEKSEFLVVTIN